MSEPKMPWPHAPTHRLAPNGTFFVTASTYLKANHFRGADRLRVLHRGLLTVARDYGWQLAWCSAAWFERTASSAQIKTVYRFNTDKLNLPDDFDAAPEW